MFSPEILRDPVFASPHIYVRALFCLDQTPIGDPEPKRKLSRSGSGPAPDGPWGGQIGETRCQRRSSKWVNLVVHAAMLVEFRKGNRKYAGWLSASESTSDRFHTAAPNGGSGLAQIRFFRSDSSVWC